MNKYLLLRDNKQSGPYSVNELALHGLKPYDLVWLEGRSAAWRYPSEIEELRPFAPAVEEQPFDRFYRKPDAKTFEPAPRDNTRVQQKDFFIRDEVKNREAAKSSGAGIQSNNTAKKIHVSLPDPKSAEPSTPKISNEENQPDPVSEPPILETIKPIVQPVHAHEAGYYSNARKQNKISEENFEETHRQNKTKESVPSTPYPGQAPVSKLLFRTVAAVCLLLGGALIGLIINYNSQQKKFQQLNQLVQEIRHKENPGTSKSVKKENISDDATKPKVEESVPPVDTTGPVYKEDIQLPVVKKERKEKKPIDSGIIDAPVDTQVKAPDPVPTVLNDEAIKKAEKQATELARKNLWQLVSVDNNPYKTGVFGGVSNLALKLTNKSLYQLEQVEVEVLYLSPENKTVNTQKVIFENVAPGEQLTINVPKSGRGVKIDYSIKKINTKEFGLAHSGM